MFQTYKPRNVQEHVDLNSIEDPKNQSVSKLFRSVGSESENFDVQDIFLQKQPYKIVDQVVEHGEEQSYAPIQFKTALQNFESGQVYRVLKQNEDGELSCNSDNSMTFADRVNLNKTKGDQERKGSTEKTNEHLVYIVQQEILFNDEVSTITYFKDITFGVLYEQIKAKQQLQNMITNTLQEKIGEPLYSVIKHCKAIEEDPIINEEDDLFREFMVKIRSTRKLASIISFKLKDMKDWQLLNQGKFV